ncbi:hypothetical protein PPQ31_001232 [Salmonella enterica]|uniref:Gp12 n=1 Tax=Salmonella newport TaxID=108619 RepID=A0A5Z7XYH9_SALNE|nr:hypothetical protein [Salmonella enterica]ECS7536457.1 hypothetical protein [Salmonella enterica subsp. enterica serovar Newport]EHQ1843474.1 hypothetical protein [Salmonella enterica subsp. enterica serovar Saintpaul]EAT6619655.1 hypothetical protein [Salmonella enterica]EBD6866754.1 hypothetical protein [Salmonella enterica]
MKYIYSGPPSGVSLNDGDTVREVILWPGREVEFAPDNEYALALVAEGHLQEVKVPKRQAIAQDIPSTGGAQ